MADMSEEVKANLSKLSTAARLRVESALKETLDRELTRETGRPGIGPAAAFSRGILFSKSGKSISLDEEILPQLAEMDEAKFKTFMDRIAILKSKSPSGMGS